MIVVVGVEENRYIFQRVKQFKKFFTKILCYDGN
jgi:hypothetical protein